MRTLDKISDTLNKVLIWIGGAFLLAMIALTCANIFLRIVWVPIRGTYELMGYFGAVATAFALGYTQAKKGHIAVDVLIDTFSDRTKRLLAVVNSLVCFIFFTLVAWQVAVKARTLWVSGEVTETLRVIYYPFTFAMAFGCAVLALMLLADFVQAVFPDKGGEE